MKEPISIKEIYDLHEKKFGVCPVITGAEFWNPEPIEVRIMNAIEDGKPYVEEDVPKNVNV